MLAALLLPRVLDRIWERPVMLIGGALMTIALAAGAAVPDYFGLLAVWFAIGLGSSLVHTPTGRLLRISCHPADRPALFSAQFALSHACWLLTYPLAGWLAVRWSMPAAFVVLAALSVVATAGASLAWPGSRCTELLHTHETVQHSHLHVHDEHHRHDHEGWEGPEPHVHEHRHAPVRHRHAFVVDLHHPHWPA